MKKHPLIALILTAVLLLSSACQKKITGEAFVVTKDRTTIKLSLLPISLIQEKELQAFYAQKKTDTEKAETENKQKKADAEGKIRDIQKKRDGMQPELTELRAALNAEKDKIIGFNQKINEANRNEDISTEETLRIVGKIEADKKLISEKIRFISDKIQELNLAMDALKDESSKIKSEIDELDGQIAYLKLNPYEGIDLIPMIPITKTDSEGRFQFISKGDDYYVFAKAKRQIATEEETYLWIEKVSDSMSLNNDNLK